MMQGELKQTISWVVPSSLDACQRQSMKRCPRTVYPATQVVSAVATFHRSQSQSQIIIDASAHKFIDVALAIYVDGEDTE